MGRRINRKFAITTLFLDLLLFLVGGGGGGGGEIQEIRIVRKEIEKKTKKKTKQKNVIFKYF